MPLFSISIIYSRFSIRAWAIAHVPEHFHFAYTFRHFFMHADFRYLRDDYIMSRNIDFRATRPLITMPLSRGISYSR